MLQQNVEHHLRCHRYRGIAEAKWLFVCRNRALDFNHALTSNRSNRHGNKCHFAVRERCRNRSSLPYDSLRAFGRDDRAGLISGALLVLALRGPTQAIEDKREEVSAFTMSLLRRCHRLCKASKPPKTYGAEARNFSIFSES